mgnify:CR=1 FL=1
MLDINTRLMEKYEIENRDSYVNCIDNNEIIRFYERYISWLEAKLMSCDKDYTDLPTVTPAPKLSTKKCHHIQVIQDYAKQLKYEKCPVCGGDFL